MQRLLAASCVRRHGSALRFEKRRTRKMDCFRDVLRCILFCGREDDAVFSHGSNPASRAIGHGGSNRQTPSPPPQINSLRPGPLPSSNPSEPSFVAPPSSSQPSRASRSTRLQWKPRNPQPDLSDHPCQQPPPSLNSSPSSAALPSGDSPVTPKNTTSRIDVPEHIRRLIEKSIMPAELLMPLSPQNYAEFFAILLYAEDYEIRKWSNFLMCGATPDLWPKSSRQTWKNKNDQHDEDFFVAFEIDAGPTRPYLLSRDLVFARPSGQINTEPFKGVIFRVISSKTVLVEFGPDFHEQHSSMNKYDVSFYCNRVCLERLHEAVSAAADPSLCKVLFPNPLPASNPSTSSPIRVSQPTFCSTKSHQAVQRILNLEALVPHLIEGPLVCKSSGDLSATGFLIQEAIIQICRNSAACKILVCAPRHRTCDALVRGLLGEIPETKLFRANAAFWDMDHVPDYSMPTCMYEEECSACPLLHELKVFDVVMATFMSSFRLHGAGIEAGHFTHIFLVDASSATEPEAAVALANMVGEKTAVVVSGFLNDVPRWVRSGIGRSKKGLRRSLFHRLVEREPYSWPWVDPMYVTRISYY